MSEHEPRALRRLGVLHGRAAGAGWLALLCAAVVLLLAAAVGSNGSVPWSIDLVWEVRVHRWVVAHPAVVTAARVVTAAGSPVAMNVLTAVAAVVFWARRHRAWALALVAVRSAELLLETLLKAVVDRPRPMFDAPLALASSSSFPSGHSAGTAAVVGLLAFLVIESWRGPTVGRVLVALAGSAFALAVALSRVLLGVHYPSDVLAGLLLGLGCAAVVAATLAGRDRARTGVGATT